MKVARPTATRVHQRLAICPLLPGTARRPLHIIYTPHLYDDPVRCTLPSIHCTSYSCQVMALTKTAETERTRLSRSAVVDRALALADREGLDALTIRRLATELGVTPMALYWHFRSKEE